MAHVRGASGADNHSVIRSITNSGSERMWSESDWKSARCGAAAEVTIGVEKDKVDEDGVDGLRGEDLRVYIVEVSARERGASASRGARTCSFFCFLFSILSLLVVGYG